MQRNYLLVYNSQYYFVANKVIKQVFFQTNQIWLKFGNVVIWVVWCNWMNFIIQCNVLVIFLFQNNIDVFSFVCMCDLHVHWICVFACFTCIVPINLLNRRESQTVVIFHLLMIFILAIFRLHSLHFLLVIFRLYCFVSNF